MLWIYALLLLMSTIYFLVPPVWNLKRAEFAKITNLSNDSFSINWVYFDDISKHFIHAVVIAEDSFFYKHTGIDFKQTISSAQVNLKSKKIVRGGSTITQQLVKMAFLSGERSYIRKVREVFGALLLEQLLDKNEILTIYANNVHFGQGLDGVKEAASFYADTTPQLLTIEDSIRFALVLPRPAPRSKAFLNEALGDFAKKRYILIVKRMFEAGYITNQQMESSLLMGDFGSPLKAEK